LLNNNNLTVRGSEGGKGEYVCIGSEPCEQKMTFTITQFGQVTLLHGKGQAALTARLLDDGLNSGQERDSGLIQKVDCSLEAYLKGRMSIRQETVGPERREPWFLPLQGS
jgi:hypothetical protein